MVSLQAFKEEALTGSNVSSLVGLANTLEVSGLHTVESLVQRLDDKVSFREFGPVGLGPLQCLVKVLAQVGLSELRCEAM